MARKRETDCGNTLNPDCCGVVDIVQCELPICRKFIICRGGSAEGTSQLDMLRFQKPVGPN